MEPLPKDEVFRQPQPIGDFNFGEKVAAVFEDMLDRSVPWYREIQRLVIARSILSKLIL